MQTENCETLNNEMRTTLAQKYYSAGKTKFTKGDLNGAEKCLIRAQVIYPTPHAKKLLSHIQSKIKTTKTSKADATGSQGEQHSKSTNVGPSTSSSSGEQGRRRRASSHRSIEQDYTRDQLEAVRSVFETQNYYTILNVNPDASTDEIKDSYKKLALLVHPDKNKAPGSNAAFQIIGKAKDTLMDPIKRKAYDMQLKQELYNRNIPTVPDFNFDIPTWLVVGGITIFAAGLFGAWWNSRQKKESSEEEETLKDETMSQDD